MEPIFFFFFFYKRVYTKQGAWQLSNMALTGDHGLAFHKNNLTTPTKRTSPIRHHGHAGQLCILKPRNCHLYPEKEGIQIYTKILFKTNIFHEW